MCGSVHICMCYHFRSASQCFLSNRLIVLVDIQRCPIVQIPITLSVWRPNFAVTIYTFCSQCHYSCSHFIVSMISISCIRWNAMHHFVNSWTDAHAHILSYLPVKIQHSVMISSSSCPLLVGTTIVLLFPTMLLLKGD